MGTVYRSGYFTLLALNVPNYATHGITSLNHHTFLNQAAREYSEVRPRELVRGQRGANRDDYSLPSAFVVGFSEVSSVEFPIDENPPIFLYEDQYHLYEEGGNTLGRGTRIQLVSATPNHGEYFKIGFTAPHSIDATSSTVDDIDSIPLSLLQAAYVCDVIAGRASDTDQSSIPTDSMDYRHLRSSYTDQAKKLRSRAYGMMGIEWDEKQGQVRKEAEGRNLNWDVKFQHRERFSLHGRR